MKNLYLGLLCLLTAFTACKQDAKNEEAEMYDENDTAYLLTPFDDSYNYPDAALGNMQYIDGRFNFEVSGTGYELGVQTPDVDSKMCANSDQGQHIHLIVDNAPYSAQYTSSFEYDIDDGEHYLLAFLSRSYHESLKHPSAHILKKAVIENGHITSAGEVTVPMLSYSRPKGTYVGQAETNKVMLDFYLSNVELGDGYTVEAKINEEIHTIDSWQPYYIEGLPMGENSITLTLLKDGEKVDTPLNPVTRNFTLKEDPLGDGE